MFNSSSFRSKLDGARSIPGRYGLRPYRIFLDVTVRDDTDNLGDMSDSAVTTTYELSCDGYAPRLETVLQEEILASAGQVEAQDLRMRLTPSYAAGKGLDLDWLRPARASDSTDEILIRIEGEGFSPNARYVVIGTQTISALSWYLILRKL